jgi:predicted dehydrogenase
MIIVGAAGHQGFEYFQLLKDSHPIVALIDTNYESLLEIYEKHSIPCFHTIEEALEKCNFSTAIICIPHTYHFSATIPLLKANKMVIKEKPLALSVDEVNKYKQFPQRSIFTIVQRPFHALFSYIEQNLYRLGKIYDFNYQYYLKIPERTSGWRNEFSISGGGVIIDMGYHILDIIIRLFGKPQKIMGTISYCYDYSGGSNLEDAASITCQYSNYQLQGNIRLNRHAEEKKEYFEIFGSNGILTMNNGLVVIKGREGNEIEKSAIADPMNKKKMFETYFENRSNSFFAKKHLDHHATIVDLIETIYKRIR